MCVKKVEGMAEGGQKDTKEWSLESQEVRNGYTVANVVT